MKLVINGDDLGYTRANTLGILETYRNGVLRSTTAMCNAGYIKEAAEMAKDCRDLGIGVHLVLTHGRPLTENRTLHDRNGNFYKNKEVFSHDLDTEELYREWKAQIERFIELFGKMPTHIDSHHHVHDATEQTRAVALRLCEEYGLECRKYSRFRFVEGFYESGANEETLYRLLKEHAGEDIEIMCHPGFCDLQLYRMSSYNLQRVVETDILCSDRLKQYLKDNGIESVHY